MNRKLLALLPLLACFAVAPNASAVALDPYGTAERPDPNVPKVAPSTVCRSLMLYLADTPIDTTSVRRYRFTGTCTINIAREGKAANMRTVPVLIDAEYDPKIDRASERVVVTDPDLGVSFSTWAICPQNPFIDNAVTCTNKGMGANKFDKFISVDDAPFARRRATIAQVNAANKNWTDAKAKGAAAGSFFQSPQLFSMDPVAKQTAGTPIDVFINVKNGAGFCPAEVDFGDGTAKETVVVWGPSADPFRHSIKHTFAKPGFFKITARALPGCESEATVYALVK